MIDEGVAAAGLPIATRAPGKCVLFGEHAIVHGRPAVVFAIDVFLQMGLRASDRMRLNGHVEDVARHAYLQAGLVGYSGPPLDVQVVSRIPKAAGLGSSAAFCATISAGLGALSGGLPRDELARRSFTVERRAQGVGSPGDTSASVAGGFISLNGGSGPHLWTVSDGEKEWVVRRVTDPGWVWIVAYSGIPRNTAETVRAVGRVVGESGGAKLLDRFAEVTLEGLAAVEAGDRARVGRTMGKNHELLREVGVSHPRLEALISAASPASDGAKLTGAGAGGSIVVLPKPGREVEASRRLAQAGGLPFVVRAAPDGAVVVDDASERRPVG